MVKNGIFDKFINMLIVSYEKMNTITRKTGSRK